MHPTPYFTPPTFGRRDLTLQEARYAVLGVPYDSSESYRAGSRWAPGAIREASREIEDYDLLDDFDLLGIPIHDMGDVEVSHGDAEETRKRVRETLGAILERDKVPVMLGGEHTITAFAAEAYDQGPFYLIFDAHMDFREDYIGNPYSHACVSRRIFERVGGENILLVGVRSASRRELQDARELGLRYLDFNHCRDVRALVKDITGIVGDRDLYLSIDADVLDPKEARGVCNPEPPGFSFDDLVRCLDVLKTAKLVGFDLTEVSPQYDSYTPVLAAKLIFKVLLKAEKS
jgi:agmatinase